MNRSKWAVPALVLVALTACSDDTSAVDAPPAFDPAVIDAGAPIAPDARYAEGRVLVGFSGIDVPEQLEVQLAGSALRLEKLRAFDGMRLGLYATPTGATVPETVEKLRATGTFAFVEPDYVRTASAVNDPYRSFQWHLDNVGAESAWASSIGNGVTVAVIDTGSTSGPLDGLGAVSGGYDFVNSDSDASDDEGHGTHVAGTIAQATDNGAGVAGLAYGATIMPVKVLDSTGSGYTSDVVSGINYAVNNGADVINMSLGSTSYSSSEASAVANAVANGVFVAAASGNSGTSTVDYPGGYAGVVAVGATDLNNARTSYSNRGSDLDLMAPGGDLGADADGDGYADGVLQETFSGSSWSYYFFEGTSMATPHVAAAAALLMSAGATATDAEDCLKDTAIDLGASGFDTSNGYGLIQPADALASLAAGTCGAGGIDTGTVDTGDTGTVDTGEPAFSCPSGYDTFSGSLSGTGDVVSLDVDGDGDSSFKPSGRTTVDVLLEGTGDDFDLYLYKYNRRRGWQVKASSTATGSSESLSWTGKGTLQITVESYSGSGDFTACVSY